MYHYTELGQVNTKDMFQKAYKEGYAVPAFNFVSIEQFNAIIDAVMEKHSPVILLASPNLHRQLGFEMLARIVQSGIDRIHNCGMDIPVALHLDHGMTFQQCVDAVEFGFSSIMIDGSALPFSPAPRKAAKRNRPKACIRTLQWQKNLSKEPAATVLPSPSAPVTVWLKSSRTRMAIYPSSGTIF